MAKTKTTAVKNDTKKVFTLTRQVLLRQTDDPQCDCLEQDLTTQQQQQNLKYLYPLPWAAQLKGRGFKASANHTGSKHSQKQYIPVAKKQY